MIPILREHDVDKIIGKCEEGKITFLREARIKLEDCVFEPGFLVEEKDENGNILKMKLLEISVCLPR